MKTGMKPSLIFGILIAIVFFIGFFLLAAENENGSYILYAGLALGVIYWIAGIIEVAGPAHMKRYQKTFWTIVVVTVPFFGAFLYHIIHRAPNRIAS